MTAPTPSNTAKFGTVPSDTFHHSSIMVTGASSGIGQATAIALATAGCRQLGIHYRKNLSGAKATAAEVEKLGAKATLFRADLVDADASDPLVAAVFDAYPDLDSWIHLAGADVLTGVAKDWTFDEKLRHLWQVDVASTIRIGRNVADRMRHRHTASPTGAPTHVVPPSIVLIGWDQAPRGMEGDAGQMFGPVKAAVMAFANSLAQELAPKVRVNTVAPGWIQTAWGENTDRYWDSRARGQSLMHRWGTPEDVAAAIVYAANPQHSFVTGQTIEVNGGWNRRFASPE